MYGRQLATAVGDVFVCAAALVYFGPFTNSYRQEFFQSWKKDCLDNGIPIATNVSLSSVLTDPYQIRFWNSEGLPNDPVSTENALLVMKTCRWPLIIDPQEQANRWIKNRESKSLKVVRLSDKNLLHVIETCIEVGFSLLLEDVEEILDPLLDPLLRKKIFVQVL